MTIVGHLSVYIIKMNTYNGPTYLFLSNKQSIKYLITKYEQLKLTIKQYKNTYKNSL